MRRLMWALLLALLPSIVASQVRYHSPGDNRYGVGTTKSGLHYSTPAFDWYVDSVLGNDASDGKSPGTALKTISALLAKTITAGQRIGLARGSTWREKLALTTNYVTVDVYGSGDRPIFNASDVVAPGSWNKTGGLTNVYDTSFAVEVSAVATEWPSVWVDGTRLTRVADAATCDGAAGTYYHAAVEGASPITIYIHSTGSTDPTSDGKVYEVSVRSSGVDTDGCTGCVVRSIKAIRPYTSFGGILVGRYGKLIDSVSDEGSLHNVFVRGFSETIDVSMTGGYAYGQTPVLWIAYEAAPADTPTVLCRNCAISNSTTITTSGFYSHTDGVKLWGRITLENCSGTIAGTPIDAANAAQLVVSGGTFTSTNGVAVNVPTEISGLSWTAIAAGGNLIQIGTASLTITATNITATAATNQSVGYVVTSTVASTTVVLTGFKLNANYGASKGSITGIRLTGANSSLTATGNDWGSNVAASSTYNLAATATLLSDYNTWRTTGTFTVGGVAYANYADYRAGTGQDAHSTGP